MMSRTDSPTEVLVGLIDEFTPAECANYFRAAGYEPD